MTLTGAAWAWDEFGSVSGGDVRRKRRLLRVAAAAADRPGGLIADVFSDRREREGAYDLLESGRIAPEELLSSSGAALARRCLGEPFVFVPVDGSSLTMHGRVRGEAFGALGAHRRGGRGLKVITAIGIRADGVPLGVAAQSWWTREQRSRLSDCRLRTLEDKESKHWIRTVEATLATLSTHAPTTRPWFIFDREGDSQAVLGKAADSGLWVTVRARHNRRLLLDPSTPPRRWRAKGAPLLHSVLDALPPMASYALDIPAGPSGPARRSTMIVRWQRVWLAPTDGRSSRSLPPIEVTAIDVRELGQSQVTEPLQWTLLTTHPIESSEDVALAIFGYAQRWRIEEFHKTWKSGACNIERTQLRSRSAVLLWATLLAQVAMRVERLKHLARNEGSESALRVLSPREVHTLVLLRKRHVSRPEAVPDEVPTIATATFWLADLGGYGGNPEKRPPGSITIRRGLDRLVAAADGLEAAGTPLPAWLQRALQKRDQS